MHFESVYLMPLNGACNLQRVPMWLQTLFGIRFARPAQLAFACETTASKGNFNEVELFLQIVKYFFESSYAAPNSVWNPLRALGAVVVSSLNGGKPEPLQQS